MYLSNGDLLAIIIALAGSCFVMVKSLKENMKLQRQINEMKASKK
jgi:hypothetical protein